MSATTRRLFSRLISRVRRSSLWNMKKKVSIHANIMARNLTQREALSNTFTYKVSLIIHEKCPCRQLCWFMHATARRQFLQLTSRVRRPSFWNMRKKLSMHANVMARNLAQRKALHNTFTYKISLIIHEKRPCRQLCWFIRATARRLFLRLTSRVRRPSLWNMKKKVSMHANVRARNLAQRESLHNAFTYKISLIIH